MFTEKKTLGGSRDGGDFLLNCRDSDTDRTADDAQKVYGGQAQRFHMPALYCISNYEVTEVYSLVDLHSGKIFPG